LSTVTRSIARIALSLLAVPFLQQEARAQTRLQMHPSVTLVQMYDDNLFSTPDESVADEVTRLSPGLMIARASRRLTVQARYRLDAELYRRHPELNTVTAAQLAALDVGWAPWTSLATKSVLSYATAQRAGELNTLTGLQVGRLPARQFSATESLAYGRGALSKTTLEYHFTREQVAGYPDSDTQSLALGLERRYGPRNRGRLAYTTRRFDFGADPTLAHIVTLGWTSEVSRFTHFEFAAGPSLFGDKVDADVTALLRQRFRKGDAGVGYVRTRTTVLGQPGPVTADGVSATLSRQVGSVRFAVGPSFFRVRGERSDTTVRRVASDLTWRVQRPLAVVVSHQFTLQRGVPNATQPTGAEIAHHTFQVGFTAASVAH
jgi:hypothetical protein